MVAFLSKVVLGEERSIVVGGFTDYTPSGHGLENPAVNIADKNFVSFGHSSTNAADHRFAIALPERKKCFRSSS